jgi:hypothetical protein
LHPLSVTGTAVSASERLPVIQDTATRCEASRTQPPPTREFPMTTTPKPDTDEKGDRIDRARKSRGKRRNLYKKPKSRKRSSGRRCRVCGKDPYPNYFFCPSCHRSLTALDEEWDAPHQSSLS